MCNIPEQYLSSIANICANIEKGFSDIKKFTWPVKLTSPVFGNDAIRKICEHFKELCVKNGCNMTTVPGEWLMLKTQVVLIVENQGKSNIKHLEVWEKVFQCKDEKEDCSNILHMIELMLIVVFTNTKLERLFSRVNRVKTDLRNQLSWNHLDVCFRIVEEGAAVDTFNLYTVTELWLFNRVCCLKSGPYKSPKRVKTGLSSEENYIDLDRFTISDLENIGGEFRDF